MTGQNLFLTGQCPLTGRYFKPWYMKRGMEERFQDPCHPLLKKAVERVQSHYDQKESQTLEELAQIEGDFDAIVL